MAVGQHLNAAVIFRVIATRALDSDCVSCADACQASRPRLPARRGYDQTMGAGHPRFGTPGWPGTERPLSQEGKRYSEALKPPAATMTPQSIRTWRQDKLVRAPPEQDAAFASGEVPLLGASLSLEQIENRGEAGQANAVLRHVGAAPREK